MLVPCCSKPRSIRIVLYMKQNSIRIKSCCFETRLLIMLKTAGTILLATPWSSHIVVSLFGWEFCLPSKNEDPYISSDFFGSAKAAEHIFLSVIDSESNFLALEKLLVFEVDTHLGAESHLLSCKNVFS